MLFLRCFLYILVFLKWGYTFGPLKFVFGSVTLMNMTFSLIDSILPLFFLWVFANWHVLSERKTFRRDISKLIIIFIIWAIVPFAVGYFTGNPNLFSSMRLFGWAILVILAPLAFNNFNQFYKFLKFFLILQAISVVYAVLYILLPNGLLSPFQSKEIKTLLGQSVELLDLFFSAAFILSIWIKKYKTNFERFLVYIILPLNILVLIVYNSRTLYFVFLVMLFFLFAFSRKLTKIYRLRLRKGVLFVVLLLCVVFISIPSLRSLVENRIMHLVNYKTSMSAMYRIKAGKVMIDKISKRPLLGYGVGEYKGLTMGRVGKSSDFVKTSTPHNFFLETAFWGGGITLIFFVFLIMLIIFEGFKAINKSPPDIGLLLLFSVAAVISLLIAIAVSPSSGYKYFSVWFYLSFIMVIKRLGVLHKRIEMNQGI